MSARARWAVIGVGLVIVLGVVALYWFNANLSGVTLTEDGNGRAWIVQSGQTVKLSADEVQADDRYVCEVDGGTYTVNGTPRVGQVTWSGDFTVSTAGRGTVILTCLPNPPRDP